MILCYRFDAKQMLILNALALRTAGCCVRQVKPKEYGLTLNRLLSGETNDDAVIGIIGDVSEKMLVMCGLTDAQMQAFLNALRMANLSAGVLKAILTETNAEWDSVRLYAELCKERAAMGHAHGGK